MYCTSLSCYSKGVSSRTSWTWTQIFAFWRRQNHADFGKQCSHCLLAKQFRERFCADESKHTRTSLPGRELLLRLLLSDPPGHICFRTGWRLDSHNTREPAADLTDHDWFSDLGRHIVAKAANIKTVEPGSEGLNLKTNRKKLACLLIYLKHTPINCQKKQSKANVSQWSRFEKQQSKSQITHLIT